MRRRRPLLSIISLLLYSSFIVNLLLLLLSLYFNIFFSSLQRPRLSRFFFPSSHYSSIHYHHPLLLLSPLTSPPPSPPSPPSTVMLRPPEQRPRSTSLSTGTELLVRGSRVGGEDVSTVGGTTSVFGSSHHSHIVSGHFNMYNPWETPYTLYLCTLCFIIISTSLLTMAFIMWHTSDVT